MIPFRGNKDQIRIIEGLLRHLGGKKVWLVEKDDSIPLFEGQDKFDPLVNIHKYWVRTDKNKFIPDIYQMKFVFYEPDPQSNIQPRQSEVHMPREIVDWLLGQGFESQLKSLEVAVPNNPRDSQKIQISEIPLKESHHLPPISNKEDIPVVIPDKAIQP